MCNDQERFMTAYERRWCIKRPVLPRHISFFTLEMNFFEEERETSDDVVRGTNDDATVSRW